MRLAVPAFGLRLGLAAWRGFGRLPPELAGLGRMKVNSKVPPIARVCGHRATKWAARMGRLALGFACCFPPSFTEKLLPCALQDFRVVGRSAVSSLDLNCSSLDLPSRTVLELMQGSR